MWETRGLVVDFSESPYDFTDASGERIQGTTRLLTVKTERGLVEAKFSQQTWAAMPLELTKLCSLGEGVHLLCDMTARSRNGKAEVVANVVDIAPDAEYRIAQLVDAGAPTTNGAK